MFVSSELLMIETIVKCIDFVSEFMEYKTSLVTKPQNPHDASKQPVQGVLKLTPDANRINPFYKFSKSSVKKNSRKSII